MSLQFSTAALLHLLDWRIAATEVCLAPGIWLGRMEGSRIEELYTSLTGQPEFRFEPEGGDPFMYTAFFRVESPPVQPDVNPSDPGSSIGRLCNLLTLLLSRPVHMVRVIRSFDRFATVHHTEMIYLYSGDGEYRPTLPELDDGLANHLSRALDIAESSWSKKIGSSRVANALSFFNHAWRSDYPEHGCLNLSIALETLFAPHSMGETTHQIAFNVAHFLKGSPQERLNTYKLAKRFYSMRSSITHGGLVDPDRVSEAYRDGFNLCRRVLCEIVLSTELAHTFDDKDRRHDLLLSYHFGPQDG